MKKTMFEKITPLQNHVQNMKRDEWIPSDVESVSIELMLMYVHGIIPIISDIYDFDKNKFTNETIKKQIIQRNIELEKWQMNFYQCDDEFCIEAMIEMNKNQLSILKMCKGLNKTMMS